MSTQTTSASPKAATRRVQSGETFVWLSGGAIIMGVIMIVALVGLVVVEGARTFWPRQVEAVAIGEARYFLHEPARGDGLLDRKDKLAFAKDGAFVYADGTAWPQGEPSPRKATIADFRRNPARFDGFNWQLVDAQGRPATQPSGQPVTPADYLARPAEFPSPYALPADKGWQPLEVALGNDSLRDNVVVMGSLRQTRNLDLRDLPRKDDGTPWKPFELKHEPEEILVRTGNKVDELGTQAYFRWLKTGVPDEDGYRRGNPSGYASYVTHRGVVEGAVEIERLEKGFLCAFVVAVHDNDKPESERLLAEAGRDGIESVWETFQRVQDEIREFHLRRVEIEKDDIGAINAQMKELERTLLRARYDYRSSGEMVTALNRLADAYTAWSALEPFGAPGTPPEQHAIATAEWRKQLDVSLAAWDADAARFELDADARDTLAEVRAAQLQRGDLQAGDYTLLRLEVNNMQAREAAVTYTIRTLDGATATLPLAQVVRAYRPNELGVFGRLGVYFSRIHEFLLDEPREANTEGGIFPVIIGTLIMTMLMSLAVVPFGVMAALYLREYAKQGWIVSTVRIAVNNLAGVPSIVFGIFGLGFFIVMVGGNVDALFYPEALPSPTFGGGGVLWASLTLALLTVPVVIVATEESLIAVPSSQREASLGAGASRWQTIRRVILPQAMPGILTGLILAMARGAGEVAPLMLVGAVKLAPDLPLDGTAPFVHLERKFMHLGFHIYDVGFQSPEPDNTKPLVFTTTLVLIILVALLNIFAIRIRNKIRARLKTSHV